MKGWKAVLSCFAGTGALPNTLLAKTPGPSMSSQQCLALPQQCGIPDCLEAAQELLGCVSLRHADSRTTSTLGRLDQYRVELRALNSDVAVIHERVGRDARRKCGNR